MQGEVASPISRYTVILSYFFGHCFCLHVLGLCGWCKTSDFAGLHDSSFRCCFEGARLRWQDVFLECWSFWVGVGTAHPCELNSGSKVARFLPLRQVPSQRLFLHNHWLTKISFKKGQSVFDHANQLLAWALSMLFTRSEDHPFACGSRVGKGV